MNQSVPRKRILFVEQNRDGTVGGSHFCLLDMLANLDRSRYEPVVLFYERNPLVPRFEELATVLVVPPPRSVRLVTGAGEAPSTWNPLVSLLQKMINFVRVGIASTLRWRGVMIQNHIDLVHLNNSVSTGTDWLLAARWTGAKCVAHQRGFAPRRKLLQSRHFDRIICISHQIQEDLLRLDPGIGGRAAVVHDGLDTEAFRSRLGALPNRVREEFGIPESTFLLGIVGNIKEWKGQSVVVRALALLRRSMPDSRCLMIGGVSSDSRDLEYHRGIKALIETLDLDGQIFVAGFREDIPDLVASLDVLVHASVEPEPMGRVILEGMALAKPVVATDHGGPREIIQNEVSGYLVPPDDPPSLADRLLRLARSPELRRAIGLAGRRRVEESFGIVRHMDRITSIYSSLWRNGAGSP